MALVLVQELLMPLLLVSGGPWLFDECDLLSAVCTTLKVRHTHPQGPSCTPELCPLHLFTLTVPFRCVRHGDRLYRRALRPA